MGSTPVQKLEVDLNGTGTLVDVTAYIDPVAGIGHQYGRSNWTAAEPSPGSLEFALDNPAGRFTPGFTTARGGVYLVGLLPGVRVKWTCGARVRWFNVTAAELDFATGVAAGSRVIVSSLDALGRLATRQLRGMLAEHVLVANPLAYYPLDESAPTEGATGVVVGGDRSGENRDPLVPTGSSLDAVTWANGTGPRLDGHSCVSFRMASTVPELQTDFPVFDPTGYNPGPLHLAAPAFDIAYAAAYATGPNTPQHCAFAVSLWFSVHDIYGTTSGSATLTDGPYVSLLNLNGAQSGDCPLRIMWRPASRRIIIIASRGGGESPMPLSASTYSVSPTAVHHLFITVRSAATSPYNLTLQGTLDGVTLAASTATQAMQWLPGKNLIGGLGCGDKGSYYHFDPVYALSGSMSHLAAYGPPDVQLLSATISQPATMALASYAADQWRIGQAGLAELADARFRRLGAYYPQEPFTALGTPQPYPLGDQETEGKTLLAALGVALRAEGGWFDASTTGGASRVTGSMDSTQRQLTPRFTVNVDTDGAGVPALAFDLSGIVTTATVTGAAKLSATFTADPAGTLGENAAVTIDSALRDITAMAALAQLRITQGRPDVVLPSTVAVDATTSKAAVTVALLADLRGGDTVTVNGLPAGILGYSTIDCTVVGVTESHTVNGSRFTLALQPLGESTYLDTAEVFAWQTGFTSVVDGGSQLVATGGYDSSGVPAAATTLDILASQNAALLSTDAADYPLYLRCDNETMQLTTCAGAAVPAGFGSPQPWRQALTGVVRGVLGTTAAVHSPPGTRGTYFVDAAGDRLLDPIISF